MCIFSILLVNLSSLLLYYNGELSILAWLLHFENFCLFHFAIIQVEEGNRAYFKVMEKGKDSAGLSASSVKMSHVFSPHSDDTWAMMPF